MTADNLPPLPEMNEVEAKSELRRAWHDLDDVERRWRAAIAQRDALQRRMDAVRAYCAQVQAAHPVPDPWVVVFDILALLDGNGEAGDE